MPFSPFGDGTPNSFLSGVFIGDGGMDSDVLHRISQSDQTCTNAVYSSGPGLWTDPATGEPTPLTAVRGDGLLFSPCDDSGLDFRVYGRVPGLAPLTGLPRIKAMSVSPEDGAVDLEILSKGRATDILSQDADDGFLADAPWSHIDRIAAGMDPTVACTGTDVCASMGFAFEICPPIRFAHLRHIPTHRRILL